MSKFSNRVKQTVGKVQWVSCRASELCDGNQSEVLMVADIPAHQGGGTAIHYRCQKCKKRFSTRF